MNRVCAYIRHVGNGDVARLPYNPYGEFCFKSWLIKTGEGRTSKGGFKLGRRQDPEESKTNLVISLFHIQALSQRRLHVREPPHTHLTSPLLVR